MLNLDQHLINPQSNLKICEDAETMISNTGNFELFDTRIGDEKRTALKGRDILAQAEGL